MKQEQNVLFQFTIPMKPVSWNALVRKHYRVVSNLADEWKEATHLYARGLKPKKPFNEPIRLIFIAAWKTKRPHDVDNIYVKSVIDMLRHDGFLTDDSTAYIPEVILRGYVDAKEDSLTVRAEAYV